MGGINNDPKGRSVPTENGTANKTINDVLGNKNDSNLMGPGLSSLYDLAGFMAYYHVHDSAKVYPDLADPVNVEAAAADWTYGSWVELIPSDTITKPFDIHWVHTAELSNQGNYQLQLGAGSAGNEESIGTIAFSRDSNQVQTASQPIQIPPQSANARVSVRLANGGSSAFNCDVKVYYHEYPV